MLDFGWSEFLFIIVLAIVLLGPRDIPLLVYQAGRLFRRVQYWRFAVTKQFDTFMEENDLNELRRGRALGDLKGDVRAALTLQDSPIETEEDELALHDISPADKAVSPAKAGAQKKDSGSQLSLGLPLDEGQKK
jgi:sec-independent protein translocase protein TatB